MVVVLHVNNLEDKNALSQDSRDYIFCDVGQTVVEAWAEDFPEDWGI